MQDNDLIFTFKDIPLFQRISRFDYQKIVGYALPDWLSKELERMGFKVETNKVFGNGVDVKVYSEMGLKAVIEIWNWGYGEYPKLSRIRQVIENLTSYNCARILLVSCLDSKQLARVRTACKPHKIFVIQLHKQLNPFYDHIPPVYRKSKHMTKQYRLPQSFFACLSILFILLLIQSV